MQIKSVNLKWKTFTFTNLFFLEGSDLSLECTRFPPVPNGLANWCRNRGRREGGGTTAPAAIGMTQGLPGG